MIKIQPLKNDKVEEYGNIIKQKIVIKKVDIDYIEKIMDRHRIKIADKEQFIKKSNEFIEEKIEKDIDSLIKGKLEEIIKIYMTYVNEYPELFKDEITSKETNEQKLMNYILRDIFNYDKIISNKETGIAYEILSSLGVKVCPYCNRQYIQTAINGNKKITRADIDHFYPKTIYPMFALSISNFIPSCDTCNKLKSSNSFTLNNNLYPYEEGVEEFRIFSYEIPDYNIKIEKGIENTQYKKFLENVEKLKLEEIYNSGHQDEVKRIVHRKRAFVEANIEQYNKQMGLEIEKDKIRDYLDYLSEEQVKRTVLGKLKNDIIDELLDE